MRYLNTVLRGPRRQQGLSLLEVAMTLLILSAGVLGLAHLQSKSLQSTSVARHRSTVMEHAHRLMESMRQNPQALSDYSTNSDAVSSASCSSNCSPTELAKADLWKAKQSMLSGLKNLTPKYTIAVVSADDVAPLKSVTIEFTWKERNGEESTALKDRSYTVRGYLPDAS